MKSKLNVLFSTVLIALPIFTACGCSNTSIQQLNEPIEEQQMEKTFYGEIQFNDTYVERYGASEDVRYAICYIDNDDIPELLICGGDLHIDGISVFTVDEDENIVFVGEFSNTGYLHYNPRNNVIVSSYGGQGSFFSTYSSIKNYSAKLDHLLYDNANRSPIQYYSGFSSLEGYTGCKDENYYELLEDDDVKEISEEEFKKMSNDFSLGNENLKEVRYEDMRDIEEINNEN